MSTVQEAASLFGSGSDEGSDPFGSTLNSSSSAQDSNPFSPPPPTFSTSTSSTSVQGKVATSNVRSYQPADDLFGDAPSDGADGLFGLGGTSDSDWLGAGNANADADDTRGGYSDYSNYADASSLSAVNQNQGWLGYGQDQPQHHYQAYAYQSSYDPQNQYAAPSSYQPPAQSSTYSAHNSNYDPISQQSAFHSSQQTVHPKSTTWNPVSDGYDPYQPGHVTTQSSFHSASTQSAYDPYQPPVAVNSPIQSVYDPHKSRVEQAPVHTSQGASKPNVQAGSSIRSPPAYGASNNYSSAYPKPPVPPVPPRITAESFRTNTFNAYDPPMLTTKTKRHASGTMTSTTSSTHAPSYLPPPPIVSNTPLAPPRRDSAPTGPPWADTSSVGPHPRSVDSPAQNSVKSPGFPTHPSRPSSRQITRGAEVSQHPPPPLPSSRKITTRPSAQNPQQKVDSPRLGAERDWTASPEQALNPEQRFEATIAQPEQPLEQDPSISSDNYDDPETSAFGVIRSPLITDADASLGLPWDHEDGPGPSAARQPDCTAPKDYETEDIMVTGKRSAEQPSASSHSPESSHDRLHVNDTLSSSPKSTAPPHDPYKPPGPTVQQSAPTNNFFSASTQATTPYDPYKPTISSIPGSAPALPPSSPPVNGYSSRPGSLRSSLESTRPHISQHDSAPPVRSSSPASIRSQPGTYVSSALKSEYGSSSYDPYAPSNRTRSATNGTISSVTSDPYTPRRQSSETQDHPPHGSKLGYPDRPSSRTDSLLTSSTYPTYAPSPSLLGTNDPLGRSSARVPIISFGFGGKVVTCFHGADMSSVGFDVALSSRQSRGVHIRSLHKLISQSALEDTTVVYPGPLFGDSGSPTVSLVRGASTQVRTKKAKVAKYLEDRISELSSVVAYANTGQLEHGRSEGKLALFSLLKVMVENDGKLNGTPEIDKAVRRALVPRLGNDTDSGLAKYSAPADGFGSSGSFVSDKAPISVTTLTSSALEKIQDFLIRGERQQAYHYALDEKLWAHAMVIASSIDRDAWQETVKEFIRAELGSKDVRDDKARPNNPRRGSLPPLTSNGRESLRVAYSLFAGQGAASVQSMLPPASLSRMVDHKLAAPLTTPLLGASPMSPNFPSNTPTNIPVEVLAKWPETVAMMISNSTSTETSAALTALGDHLSANSWTEAAHVCYLLSPQTSQLGGLGSLTTRLVLVGSASPAVAPIFSKDPDSVLLSEIVEFAYSLSTPQKGQEQFPGLPHLQPYRLIRAHQLAELGHVQLATRYCDAVTASVNRASVYFTPTFIESLRDLSARLIAAPSLDKSGSWIAGSLSKPSLDKVGGWLGGQFTKFIAGEGDSSPAEVQKPGLAQGPFSHYSSISTTDLQSSHTSPRAATPNQYPSVVPQRTGSAIERTMTGSPRVPVNRSSSAMDVIRPQDRRSPVQRLTSTGISTTNFSAPPTSMYRANGVNGYGHYQQTGSGLTSGENSPSTANGENDGPPRSPWWDSLKSSDTQTPTATTFQQQGGEDAGNFISLMDDIPMPNIPSHRSTPPVVREEEEEDLGFGNNANKRRVPNSDTETDNTNGSAATENKELRPPPKIEATKSEGDKPSSGSWLSRWWKKEGSGPIKANLGEETAFYYDKELGKWVNKKAGANTPKPSPPPPPQRAQTTSPGKVEKPPSSPGNLPPPPPRPASAVDLSSPPRKTVPRVKSNLVPGNTQSVPSTPSEAGFLQPPIPPNRPRSQASKKNVRSRYVDVFQQSNPPSPAPSS